MGGLGRERGQRPTRSRLRFTSRRRLQRTSAASSDARQNGAICGSFRGVGGNPKRLGRSTIPGAWESSIPRGAKVKGLVLVTALAASVAFAAPASADWNTPVGTNAVADAPIAGGGYPVPPGATKPDPGTCRAGSYNSNRSESWITVKPGTETLVGVSKLFFENFSTFYDFHLGAYAIQGGAVTGQSQVQGYDCVSTGTQAMPPSWTDNTDPNAAFDTQGRVYQTTLPFNAFWEGGLHPNGAIDLSYSDDLGLHLDQGQRRAGPREQQQPDEPDAGPRRGQAVGRGQQRCRQPFPGPRLRDVDDVQRQQRQREDPHRRLTRPGGDVLQGRHHHAPRHDHARDDVRLPLGRQ